MKRSHFRKISSIVVLISAMCAFPVLTFANTGVFYGAGNQVVPINNDRIQLVREEVDIKLTISKDNKISDNLVIPLANVTAIFHLKNTTQNIVSLQMGFPFLDLQGFGDEKEVISRMDFRVVANGQVIPTELKEGLIDKKLDPQGLFKKVFVWDDSFAPGEGKTVVVTYKMLMSIASANSNMRNFDEIGERYYELDKLFLALNYSFGYITKTAYTWKGPVEEAVFKLDAKELIAEFKKPVVSGVVSQEKMAISRPVYLESIYPSGYQKKDNVYEWVFKNTVPEEGLSVNFIAFYIPTEPKEVKDFITKGASTLGSISREEYISVVKQYYSLLLSRNNSTDRFVNDYFKDVGFINDKTKFVFEEDRNNIIDILDNFNKLAN